MKGENNTLGNNLYQCNDKLKKGFRNCVPVILFLKAFGDIVFINMPTNYVTIPLVNQKTELTRKTVGNRTHSDGDLGNVKNIWLMAYLLF